jgi:hypothetical protein
MISRMTPTSKEKYATIAVKSAAEAKSAANKTAEASKSIRNIEMNGKPQFSILYLFSFAAIFLKDNVTTIVLTLTKLNDFR